MIYLDDMLIYSDNLKEYQKHIRKVLEQLKDARLFLQPSKCMFHIQEVEFLRFVIVINGIIIDSTKVESMMAWPILRSPHDIWMFLGLANFYR